MAALALVAIVALSGCSAPSDSASQSSVPATSPTSLSTDAPTLPGPSIQLTVAGGCPAELGDARTVENARDLSRTLLPTESAPVSGLICYYQAWPNGTEAVSTVVRKAVLDGEAAKALAASLQKLSLVAYLGAHNCPADLVGQAALVAFHYYDDDVDVDLWYHDGGCQSINNGRVTGQNPAAVLFPGRP
jgi:hypothetical protein